MEEDIVDSLDGFCISIWFNGCDIRCKNCHNQKCWDAVNDVPIETVVKTVEQYYDKSVRRKFPKSLSILGGEPLTKENRSDCARFLKLIKGRNPEIYIRLWTGRTKEQLAKESKTDADLIYICNIVNELIVGPYIEELQASLPLRGSSNQEILINGKDYEVRNGNFIYIKSITLEVSNDVNS